MSKPTAIPGLTQCHCDPPRYLRRIDGTWGSRIYQEGTWQLIDDGAKQCRGCAMDLRQVPAAKSA